MPIPPQGHAQVKPYRHFTMPNPPQGQAQVEPYRQSNMLDPLQRPAQVNPSRQSNLPTSPATVAHGHIDLQHCAQREPQTQWQHPFQALHQTEIQRHLATTLGPGMLTWTRWTSRGVIEDLVDDAISSGLVQRQSEAEKERLKSSVCTAVMTAIEQCQHNFRKVPFMGSAYANGVGK